MQVRAGKLRALAVTGPTRHRTAPEVPAVAETVPGYEAIGWFGWLAPAGTPAPIVQRLAGEIGAYPAIQEVSDRLRRGGPRHRRQHARAVRRVHPRGIR